jgi:transcriptional regulator with XRE-family HTH domain
MPSSIFAERYGALVAVLADARREAGVTQMELAARLERPQSYVSKIERRERRVDAIELIDWSRALGLDPKVLFANLVERLGGE